MNRGEFSRAVFDKLNIPIDGGRLAFGVAWAAYESTEAKNNPWATTYATQNSTDFNSVGVKNYATFEDGVNATVATLLLVPYAHLLSTLRDKGSVMREIMGALNASPWGSKVTEQSWTNVVEHYDANNVEVPGSGGDKPVPTLDDMPKVAEAPKEVTSSDTPVDTSTESVVEENVVTEPEGSVPTPVEVEDTLEAREAAAAAAEVAASAVTTEPVAESKSATPATSYVEASFKDKVVAAAEDFLAVLRSL
ncbi:MAG TPA: hypothetical protein VGF75_06305 [Candidatus Saccharimonadales bacterium]|jgi:hypothetical protein